jgi:FG-GAP-like repeat
MKFPSVLLSLVLTTSAGAETLERLPYNHPGLRVDLGVGLWAWPLPMDFDGDGDLDLVVSCPDKPYNGTYFFENPDGAKLPVFKPGKRISKGLSNARISYVDGKPRVLTPGQEYPDFLKTGLDKPQALKLAANIHPNKVRANEWHYTDYEGDGKLDLLIGVEDWTDYVWDNAYDENGYWTNGLLKGLIYQVKNTGTTEAPVYDKPKLISAAGTIIDGFGMPSPTYADFDADGDLDLLCGEFIDGFTYYTNTGTREKPKFALGLRLKHEGNYVRMDLEMITPTGIDWDRDGDTDLICGDEDGRVALLENTGALDDRKVPHFLPPVYFQQEAEDVKCGALATPAGVDWDGDGDDDILSGNTAGYIEHYENLSGPGVAKPKWAAPRKLTAGGKVIRIMAGANGSIQGPAESKWGYTVINVADWDADGLPDVVVNSILGKVHWYRNIGTRKAPALAAAQPIEVEWQGEQPRLAWGWMVPEGKALLTQWRTTPALVDLNGDNRIDLVMLDQEGYLAYFQRNANQTLAAPQRVLCDQEGKPLHFNPRPAGKSGRRKLTLTDWNGDGALDILINSANAEQWQQISSADGKWCFKNVGNVSDRNIEGHDTNPTTVDFDGDGHRDLLIGAEDGRFYHLQKAK